MLYEGEMHPRSYHPRAKHKGKGWWPEANGNYWRLQARPAPDEGYVTD